jgi:hypothetical protein
LLARARDWLEAADPGGVRRRHGVRTLLAALATILMLLGVPLLLGRTPSPGVVLFGVEAAFVCALVVSDPRRHDRAITLGWSVPVLAAAATLAALSEPVRFLSSAVLLALIFLAFAARRAGMRAGELAVLATMGMYFAIGAGATVAELPWFVVAAGVGIAWLAAWELVLLPYDPIRSIRSSARAYAGRIASVVAGASALLRASGAGPDARADGSIRDLARHLRLAELTRRVIETQFPGARAPGGWTSQELTRFRVALYDAELGAGQLVEGCTDAHVLSAIPAAIRDPLASTLDAIAVALGDVSEPRHIDALAGEADALRARVQEAIAAQGDVLTDAEEPPAWVVACVRIANGARRIAHAMATVRSLQASAASTVAEPTPRPTATATATATARAAGGAQVRMGPMSVHVTTALGIQAVLATGVSMAFAWLAGVEHPSWVFWTSFVVIAGSLDESLRRVLYRVIGTVLGVFVGVGLAAVLPDDLIWIFAGASLGVFMAIYVAPVSHAWFVFWLNMAFALVYARPGGRTAELLVERPLMTIIGAAIAAVIVALVLPIRRPGRYVTAVIEYLSAVRRAIGEWTGASAAPDQVSAAISPLPAIDATYRQVEALGRARQFATPFSASRQAADAEETEMAALAAAATRLGTAVELDPEAARQPIAVAVAGRIDGNLEAALALARGDQATLEPTVADLLGPMQAPAVTRPSRSARSEIPVRRAGHLGTAVLAAMTDVHACVLRVGATLADHRDG